MSIILQVGYTGLNPISKVTCWSSRRGRERAERIQATANLPLSPFQWQAISLTVIEKVQIAAAILGSLFLIASISWLIWSTFSPSAKWQRQDLLFQICYGMYGFMDVVCIGGSESLSPWEMGSYMPVRQKHPSGPLPLGGQSRDDIKLETWKFRTEYHLGKRAGWVGRGYRVKEEA